eukprot:1141787-Rhodomonas_salina.3
MSAAQYSKADRDKQAQMINSGGDMNEVRGGARRGASEQGKARGQGERGSMCKEDGREQRGWRERGGGSQTEE